MYSSGGVQTYSVKLDSEEVYESKVKKKGDKKEKIQQKCIFGKNSIDNLHRKDKKQVSQDIEICNRYEFPRGRLDSIY